MSRAQERGSGRQPAEQVPEQPVPEQQATSATGDTGASPAGAGLAGGAGQTAGASATGSVALGTGTATTTTGTTTGTALRDRDRGPRPDETPAQPGYARGAAPSAGYRTTEEAGGAAGYTMGGAFAVLAGLLTFFAGLAAVVRRAFYPALPGYAYRLNVHSWGWILLVVGVLLFAAGACALLGMAWARAAGVALAVLSAIGAFFFLPYTPVWGTILVFVSVVAIWGLIRGSGQESE